MPKTRDKLRAPVRFSTNAGQSVKLDDSPSEEIGGEILALNRQKLLFTPESSIFDGADEPISHSDCVEIPALVSCYYFSALIIDNATTIVYSFLCRI